MDWQLAITRNRDQIRTIVLVLFALAKMRVGSSLFTLRRDVFAAIMLVLRPAESAVRRLILIAALELVLKRPLPGAAALTSPHSWGEVTGIAGRRGDLPQTNAFKLFDPLKSFDPENFWDVQPVWESGFDLSAPAFHYTSTLETPLDATHIAQRLNALIRALDNIPAQARRLMRWQAKRDAALKARKPTRMGPMRPGLPPGWRERKIHEIDEVLRECHGLAHDRLDAPPDTS